jgi:hypothetical protein
VHKIYKLSYFLELLDYSNTQLSRPTKYQLRSIKT